MPKLEAVADLVTDPRIEAWIDQNANAGRPSTFKTMRLEKDGVNVYPQKADGIRYGAFGLHLEDDGIHVTHCRTGGLCGLPFSSEKSARRFVFCIANLTKWHKVEWRDTPPYVDDPKLLLAVREAHDYCSGKGVDCPNLLELIKPHVEDQDEDVEPEPVAFGSDAKAMSRKQAVVPKSSEKSAWGMRVTA